MSLFQLDPASLAARTRNHAAPLTLGASLIRGAISFTILSIAGFVPWAVFGLPLKRALGEAGMYAVCAAVFIALSGPLMHRLIMGAGSLSRFYKVFTLAFIPYSIAWTIGWIALRGHVDDHARSVIGLLAGAIVMGPILAAAFDALSSALKVIVIIFLSNAAGYFLGGIVEAAVPGIPGKLLWGVFYGLGLGAGLGWAFHECQTSARRLLAGSLGLGDGRTY